jgi:hypothetical protein
MSDPGLNLIFVLVNFYDRDHFDFVAVVTSDNPGGNRDIQGGSSNSLEFLKAAC